MVILPVLDLMRGQVVRGVAGKRSEYQPIVSRLTSSSEPLEVARAIRETFGLMRFYIADLDAIIRQKPQFELYRRLKDDGFELLVDAGIRNRDDAAIIQGTGVAGIVVGLETCRSPHDLAQITQTSNNVIFSLDLLSGRPTRHLESRDWLVGAIEILGQAVSANVQTVLLLDLSDVGMGTGGSTDSLCRYLRTEFPSIRVITGGGVRGPVDLKRLQGLGVSAVLVASALHDGRLTRNDFPL